MSRLELPAWRCGVNIPMLKSALLDGIKLGDSIGDVRRRYGLRLYFGVTLSETDKSGRQANLCGYAPTLAVEFDEDERVNHMELTLTSCPEF